MNAYKFESIFRYHPQSTINNNKNSFFCFVFLSRLQCSLYNSTRRLYLTEYDQDIIYELNIIIIWILWICMHISKVSYFS